MQQKVAVPKPPAHAGCRSLKQLDCEGGFPSWKMFLAEVSEEGLALMDDQMAREAACRAFRCAEFFMMEEARRRMPRKQLSSSRRKLLLRKRNGIPKRIPAKNNSCLC
ncbi:MAG: hypothetical protein ACLT8C_00140 [Akkermansia muciniphila]